MKDYGAFLAAKLIEDSLSGFTPGKLNSMLFDWQADIVRWALKRGRAAIWADCGLGKTPMQLAWADAVARHEKGRVLILAPLAVTKQTVCEGVKFGYEVAVARTQAEAGEGITVTNYEMLEHFDPAAFCGIVLDESSILKSYTGSTRTAIINAFAKTPYRLACTATPAPNDHMELGNHAEFLGTMTRTEMLSMFFVHDGGETAVWRLKGHAKRDFWRWLASWAVMVCTPSDLGYPDNGFKLPALKVETVIVKSDAKAAGMLFPMEAITLDEQRAARRASLSERVATAAGLMANTPGPWVAWCNLNDESTALARSVSDAIEVAGSNTREEKEDRLNGFTTREHRCIVTKPEIGGFGLNWQHCSQMVFVGLSHSWEQYYQAIRRCWRFGQKHPVKVYIILSDMEAPILRNIQRKERDSQEMAVSMAREMSAFSIENIKGTRRRTVKHEKETKSGTAWEVRLGDCVEELATMAEGSVDFSVFSPPFASLYTYSASDHDMGNCKDIPGFMEHFRFLTPELFRVTKPGRLLSFHCMNLPKSKERDGIIGIKDFRGALVREFEAAGFVFHSEVCIWKDPVTAMQRTKAIGLLYKQLKKDSALSRQGIPDYLVTMRKPGENPDRVTKTPEDFPVALWQQYASPVWMDINPSDTLQYRSAREDNDERHICPLQLDVIRRAVRLWTNPGDLVLDPFAGIGSTGDVALAMGRRFIGFELKRSYYEQAWKNCEHAYREASSGLLVPVEAA